MTVRVEALPLAEEHLAQVHAWWCENRHDAPDMVLDEYDRIVALLAVQPEIGRRYVRRGTRNVRWILMHGTEHKLFYHYAPGGTVVSIIAIWGGMRKGGPPIALPG